MKDLIIENINNPEKLESLYRENKKDFRQSFYEISPQYDTELIKFWKIRLDSESQKETGKFDKKDLIAVILISLIAGTFVKLPDILPWLKHEIFYPRNLAIIVFSGIIFYTLRQNKIFETKKFLTYVSTAIILLIYVNLLPYIKSDSINNAFYHVPFIMWCIWGIVYTGFEYKNIDKRIDFIRYNGELVIMTGLILIAGGFLTGLTNVLFEAIKMNITEFYFKNVAVYGAVSAPIVSMFLINTYPNITSKIAPVIAKIFTPLVLITLVIYLITLFFSGSNLLLNRDLLIAFNIMLLCVTALIIFSLSELSKTNEKNVNVLILFLLSVVTILINLIALGVIISRIIIYLELTPNRTVVLVSNILIFINLILISKNLYLSYFKNKQIDSVERTTASYLPVYLVWTLVVIFILPFIFWFR
ncbi:MAG: DUF4153 domain-containing protein [Ignavibacteriae bacterium]|nr:MAG: DUF4153 domain-containing protein [Ignavibacteriota bacterium]